MQGYFGAKEGLRIGSAMALNWDYLLLPTTTYAYLRAPTYNYLLNPYNS
jgi:hypothetical protein